VPGMLEDRPIAVAFVVLFLAAMVRGQMLDGLARRVAERAD